MNYANINRTTSIGFATMETLEQARAAMERLHDAEFQGRHLFVDYAAKAFLPPAAQAPADRAGGGGDRGRERDDGRGSRGACVCSLVGQGGWQAWAV